ncbi:preprotein translocase subunit SecG [Patescibacteria group bacterium]
MKNIIVIFQIIISVSLIVAVVLQSRGTGLGSAFGGGGESYRSKRGVERILFLATIVLGVLFFLSSVASLLV